MAVIGSDTSRAYKVLLDYVNSNIKEQSLLKGFLKTTKDYIAREKSSESLNFYLEYKYDYSSSLIEKDERLTLNQTAIRILREYEDIYNGVEPSDYLSLSDLDPFRDSYVPIIAPLRVLNIKPFIKEDGFYQNESSIAEDLFIALIIHSIKSLPKYTPMQIIRLWSEIEKFSNDSDFTDNTFSVNDSYIELILKTINDLSKDNDALPSWQLIANLA